MQQYKHTMGFVVTGSIGYERRQGKYTVTGCGFAEWLAATAVRFCGLYKAEQIVEWLPTRISPFTTARYPHDDVDYWLGRSFDRRTGRVRHVDMHMPPCCIRTAFGSICCVV